MADALVPLGGARSRSKYPRGGGEGVALERCTTLWTGNPPKNLATSVKTSRRRKRKASTPAEAEAPVPELSNEIVLDILVRLPVKTVLRCRAVCKAWLAIISDPFFTGAHLRWSASRCEQNPRFIITPHTLDRVLPWEDDLPTTFSNRFTFYQWQQGAPMATLMHDEDFGSQFGTVRYFAPCDGLVLAPTDTRLYLFNPATRESFTLPGDGNPHYRGEGAAPPCCCAGLGLDPRTGKYKVVRAFYQSKDPDTTVGKNMGMEVFTVPSNGGGDGSWRVIRGNLPYPAANWNTGVTVNGFLFWRLAKNHHRPPPWGLLHLSLADETFGITRLPDTVDPVLPCAFSLDELHGELCVSERTRNETVIIWAMQIQDGGQGQYWEQRCIVRLCDLIHPVAFLPGVRLVFSTGYDVNVIDMTTLELTTQYDMERLKYQGRRARTWKNLAFFNIHRYTESLVRISA